MSANVKALGYAPNDSRCDCEHAKCTRHRAGACRSEATFLVEAYGMQQKLCPTCLRIATQADKEANNGR